MAKYKIEGMAELERSLKKLGKVPQSVATKAARSGAAIALKATQSKAPIDTGDLKKGVVLKGERKTKPGKKVYDVIMDPAMNDIFAKTSADGKRSYYPASQEYGFQTVDGGYIPGYNYLLDGLVDNKTAIERKMVDVAAKAVDKALKG